MKGLRIAMVAACPFPSPQGSQVLVAQMAEQLAARGHEVHLLTYGQGCAVRDAGYVHHRIPRLPGDDASRSGPRPLKPALDALLVHRLVRLLGRAPFDVVHCHNYEAAMVGLLARMRRGVPVVYHSHNLMEDELPTYFATRGGRRLAAWTGQALDRSVPRAADHVVALCEYSAAELQSRGVAPHRVSVIPPAVVDEGPARPAEDARDALGLDQGGPWIGYCGNLDAYQNLSSLLEAMACLDRLPAARLLIATHRADPALSAAIRARSVGHRIRVLEVPTWRDARLAMEAADLLVLPRGPGSGWPIKLLNYLALGRAIVAAGCGAKVLVHGTDGYLCPDGRPAALAAAFDLLLSSEGLRERLGQGGRARYLRDFTWDAVLPAVERVYTRCGAGNPLPTPAAHVNVGGWHS